jgi:hypothetical protein
MTLDRLGDEIRREFGRFGPAAGMPDLVAAWPGAVGEAIAANAWPTRFARDGTLHVATSSSAWAFELAHLEGTIRDKLAGVLDKPPSRLRFAPGQLPEPPGENEKSPARTVPEVSAALRAEADRIAAPVEAPELREAIARAAAASLATASSDRRV